MFTPKLLRIASSLEPFVRVLADRLEHEEVPFPYLTNEALSDQSTELVESGRRNCFRGIELEIAHEHGQMLEDSPLRRGQKLVAPRDRCAQGLLALRRVVRARSEQLKAPPEPLEDLFR